MLDIPIQPLVKTFFVSFSRFEYALKRAGYVKRRGNGNDAEVDWIGFVRRYETVFENILKQKRKAKLMVSVQYIWNDPPKKLVLVDKPTNQQLGWQLSLPRNRSLEGLLILVRRIRNNLFHGEKPETTIGGTQRGLDLIEHANEILSACVSLDKNVKQFYEYYAHPLPRINGKP